MLRNLDSKRSAEKLEKGPSNFRPQRRHKGAVYRLDTPVRLLTGFGVACAYNIDTAPKRQHQDSERRLGDAINISVCTTTRAKTQQMSSQRNKIEMMYLYAIMYTI